MARQPGRKSPLRFCVFSAVPIDGVCFMMDCVVAVTAIRLRPFQDAERDRAGIPPGYASGQRMHLYSSNVTCC
jgi:hypothetical protein